VRALKGYETVLGPEHASTLTIVNSLANLCSDHGMFKEVGEMYRRALKRCKWHWAQSIGLRLPVSRNTSKAVLGCSMEVKSQVAITKKR
jgi:hypothetical protein